MALTSNTRHRWRIAIPAPTPGFHRSARSPAASVVHARLARQRNRFVRFSRYFRLHLPAERYCTSDQSYLQLFLVFWPSRPFCPPSLMRCLTYIGGGGIYGAGVAIMTLKKHPPIQHLSPRFDSAHAPVRKAVAVDADLKAANGK